MYKFDQEKYWAGSSASFYAVLDAQERAVEYMTSSQAANFQARGREDMKAWIDDMVGPVYTPEGSVGVINIRGSLVNGEAGIMRLYGVLGYDDIRAAITEAIADKNIKSILYKVDSGGGQVSGVAELGQYMREASTVKPSKSFSDTIMASAAYWLGISADEVLAGATATVGSVGVLIVHQEVSKMLAENGVTTNIIRSGKYKALVNRYEPLSDLAKEELQSQVDDIDGTFTSYVGERRNVSAATARSKMGQGREFLGVRALDAGLVDKITTFSDVHGLMNGSTASKAANARKPVARAEAGANNLPNLVQGNEMKFNLTTEQLAAVASGASLESLGLTAEQLAAVKAAASASTETEPTEEEKAAKAAAEAAAKTEAETKAAAQAAAGNSDEKVVIAFLRNELKDTQATLAKTNLDLTTAQAAAVANQDERKAMLAIARASIGNMQVALGSTNTADTLSDDKVVAEHTRLSDVFGKKFPIGRTSAATQETTAPDAKAMDPSLAALLSNAKTQFIK